MAKPNPIPPFPDNIDRTAFGHWLSGFTDGEGCFFAGLYYTKKRPGYICPRVWLAIDLRLDDAPILGTIRSFLQCGRLYVCKRTGPSKPKMLFVVARLPDLAGKVIPHFDRFPLYAKKARDYRVWREAVFLVGKVAARRSMGGRDVGASHVKWTAGERDQFIELSRTLKTQRRYEAAGIALPLPEVRRHPGLFDGLS